MRARHADDICEQHGRDRRDEAEQQPNGNEQEQRIVEIDAERAGPIATLRAEPKRQAHQRAECGFDRAEVHGGGGEQQDSQRNHLVRARRTCRDFLTGRALSINPSRNPPRRRSRRSASSIRPSSRSWS